jgi:hypothetical protein
LKTEVSPASNSICMKVGKHKKHQET